MKDFLFAPEQARTPIGKLSGGERGRLMLARALAQPSNLMVLDEPTNDLDLETLELLQELLGDYPGTILIVSHDRDFLDRIATSVIVGEGGGRWREYAGGYSDLVAQRGYGLSGAPVAEAPSRRKRRRARRRSGRRRNASCRSTRSARWNCCRNAWTPCAPNWMCWKRRTRRRRFAAREPAAFQTATNRYGELRAEKPRRPRTSGWRSRFCARASRVRSERLRLAVETASRRRAR